MVLEAAADVEDAEEPQHALMSVDLYMSPL
jgi:hypothetical protein